MKVIYFMFFIKSQIRNVYNLSLSFMLFPNNSNKIKNLNYEKLKKKTINYYNSHNVIYTIL